MTEPQRNPALIVIDVQRGFEDPVWGERDNTEAEANIAALIAAWRERGLPLVYVRHDSADPASPLHPARPGNRFKAIINGDPDLLVSKQVNSAFYGTPDLHAWLQDRHIGAVTICGITTNHCCETTARMAGNLGYETVFALDATHTFGREDLHGATIGADQLARVTAANLQGEFAIVCSTAEVLAALRAAGRSGEASADAPGARAAARA